MSLFEKLVFAIQREVDPPALYGAYHLICVFLVILGTAALCIRLRDAKWSTVCRILCLSLAAMVILELCKQLVLAMDVEDGVAEWGYAWFAFPYQFCSTPLYVLPFAIFLPEGRVRNACLAFLSSFALFGGLVVMVYPGDVFSAYAVIDLQTMVHHGLQVVLGIFLAVHERHKLGRRYFLGAVAVFAVTVGVALLLDVGVHYALVAAGRGDVTFNMFFISPFHDCTLPLLSLIQPHLPYPVFLLMYILGFSLAAAVVHAAILGITALVERRTRRA